MRLRPRLFQTARQIAGSDADALDALQEAFCRLWSRRESLQGESHAEGASVVAVRNAAIDTLRRRRQHTDVEAIDMMESSQQTARDVDGLFEEVEAIIARELSDRDRRVLYLRDRYEYEIEAIAVEENMTEANVRVVLSRARRTVREAYRRRIAYND